MIQTRIATAQDIQGVLALQERYLFRNLTEEQRQQGFVTTPFTVSQIEEIIQENGLFIAEDEERNLLAYAFAGSWKYFEKWEIFNHMVSRFPDLSFQDRAINTENSFQYGPVCIASEYRGTGLLNLIFEEMRLEFSKKYPISVTFINKVNIISEIAHTKKLGWEIIDEFDFNDNTYIGLALDMHKSVLN
ncbi:MAG: GNAT family acetyltransferase [Crocinitomicaceae bacterium]|nr:GNAT family acetyltransferase [Crocinitomicaceae bacterium]